MRYVGNWLWCLRNLEGTPRKRTGSGRPRKARKVERGPTSNENATNPNENMKPNENMNMNSNENMNPDENMSPDGSMGEGGGSSGQGDDDQAERSSDQGQRDPSDPAPGQSIRQTARGMLEESDGKLEDDLSWEEEYSLSDPDHSLDRTGNDNDNEWLFGPDLHVALHQVEKDVKQWTQAVVPVSHKSTLDLGW